MTSAPVRWFKGFLVVFSLFTTTLFFGALILSLVPIKFILKKTVRAVSYTHQTLPPIYSE